MLTPSRDHGRTSSSRSLAIGRQRPVESGLRSVWLSVVLALGCTADDGRDFLSAQTLELDPPLSASLHQSSTVGDEVEAEVEELETVAMPQTAAARKVLALRQKVYDSLSVTRYRHRTIVRPKEGLYQWDCSAMMSWFLRKVAPKARGALEKKRPVARDYYRTIARASTKRTRKGWRRLAHIEDVRPGDVFAWIRPPGFPSRNTGHTGFAMAPAQEVPGREGHYTLRIMDATSLPHDKDTRDRDGEGGIGEGTIMFRVDENGRGTGYGWFGERSRGLIETDIVFGRIHR